MESDKKADLAGPGIGDYAELERVLPADYAPLLNPRSAGTPLLGGQLGGQQ